MRSIHRLHVEADPTGRDVQRQRTASFVIQADGTMPLLSRGSDPNRYILRLQATLRDV